MIVLHEAVLLHDAVLLSNDVFVLRRCVSGRRCSSTAVWYRATVAPVKLRSALWILPLPPVEFCRDFVQS